MTDAVISPQKLIEVALPLDAINVAAVREGYIYRGNPSALHKWWAQRPLAAARAVIFGQLVNDPEDLWRCQNPGHEPNAQVKGHWTKARARLFSILEDLVKWESTTNEAILEPAREAIRQSWRDICELNRGHPKAKDLFDPEKMPGLHDPFAGGGTIPLEAQRLGLEAHASDLNPVAVLINKAMIEIPPKFAGRPPVHPDVKDRDGDWKSASGLAEDVRRYGRWVRDEAFKRIGHLYPLVEVTSEMAKDRPELKPLVGKRLTVIAWLWTRTVKSPNPAFRDIDVPLASTFVLSTRKGRESYVQPVVGDDFYEFAVKVGEPPESAKTGTKASRGGNFRCVMSGVPIDPNYIRAEGKSGRLGQRLMAVAVESEQGRLYLNPSCDMETVAKQAKPQWQPEGMIVEKGRAFTPNIYGLIRWSDLYTSRQLAALTTLSDLIGEVREKIRHDARSASMLVDERSLDAGGAGADAYGDAVSVYLAFAVDKASEYGCTIVPWYAKEDRPKGLFVRQAIPMLWDFAEVNPFTDIGGSFGASVEIVAGGLAGCCSTAKLGEAKQAGALDHDCVIQSPIISTDPPYYDNVPYADLSDFFYVWLRRNIKPVYPSLFAMLAVPKAEELVATPERHGGREKAEVFFLDGMTQVMRRFAASTHPAFPVTIYYAFKQSESDVKNGTVSTGWETFLDAVIGAGFAIHGTWPMRTERSTRSRGISSNALASSIILVCRPRTKGVGTVSRRQYIRQLNEALPLALDAMTRESEGLHSPVAPVDLSQAIIGPGMAIFSRYDAVLEADGTPMSVKTALQLINRFLAEDDFDADTQFCLHWFEQHGWDAGKFGEADTLARAKGTSVEGVKAAGVIESGGGNVRLLRWKEYPATWDPRTDSRLPVWEALHQLIRAHNTDGDSGAARVLAGVAGKAEAARQLAYRLYTLCERANRAEDARAYNEVVTGWSGIESAAVKLPVPRQGTLFNTE